MKFDIPAQPMPNALYVFSATTGIEVLVDARSAAGRRSTDVRGVMAPREALDILLAGSGLVSQKLGDGAIALRSIAPALANASIHNSARLDLPYFADVQRAVLRVLCEDARTLPGRYRVALKLWIGQSGAVVQSKRLDTTGDYTLDAAIDAVMQSGLQIGQPPADLPQPIVLLISRGEAGDANVCSSGPSDLRHASSR